MSIDKLTFNNSSEGFDTTIFNGNETYDLTLCDFTKDEETNATSLANKISGWLVTNIDATKKYAASELLSLKNESWLEENQTPLTETSFVELIQLESIIAFPDYSFQIFFKDNDIFWGHSILVDIDKDFNFARANVAG